MEFNLMSLLSGVVIFILGFIVKLILDLNLAPILVKYFSYINFISRSIFRKVPPPLSGEWNIYWESKSEGFSNPNDRLKKARIYQFNTYIFCEYSAKGIEYCFYGNLKNKYLTGIYWDKKDTLGYHGAFQLQVINSKKMIGRWAGHSSKNFSINTDEYIWEKSDE